MYCLNEASKRDVAAWIADHRPGTTLAREFYVEPAVYALELERIWRRGWLFVGHTCEIPAAGDYFTFAVDYDSLIVVRDDDRQIRALWNVCRHRGTQMCTEQSGHVGRFVCPYHQWTYRRNGDLAACRGMHDEIDKQTLGLLPAHVRELEGFIFVCLDDDPPAFDPLADQAAELLRPQGLDRARVAKAVDYLVDANWKLVWENNRECYHCNANHPQYIQANFDHYNADDTSPRIRDQIEAAIARTENSLAAAGLAYSHKDSGMCGFPDAEQNIWYAANRTPLVEGFVSETMDGSQVAPLMGDYESAETGTLRFRTMPNMWFHASCDHAVSTRLLPAGLNATQVRVTWLVDAEAKEGVDYQLEDVMPFWQFTSEQDWELCKRAQQGVLSSRYISGPLSRHKEYNVDSFIRWTLHQLSQD